MTTIVRVGARALDIPMKKAFGIAGGAQEVARNVLVRVELASGAVGWGEGAPLPAFNGETQEGALRALDGVIDLFDGLDIGGFHWRDGCDRAREVAKTSASAACALEAAIVDANCRSVGKSMLAFFGRSQKILTTDVTITTGTVEDASREARELTAFATLKIKVGGKADHDVELDVARVLAVAAARPDAKLLLDANGGLSVEAAVYLAETLRRRGVVPALFEQPTSAHSLEALAEVRRRSGLRVALDESITSADDVVRAQRAGAIDAVNIKLMKSGIIEGFAIHAAAKRLGLAAMIGGMVEARMAVATSACFAAGLGGFSIVDLDTPLFLADDPFDGGYRMENDRIDVGPITLGHGVVPRVV